MDKASYAQLVFGAAIMTDKARLLAGEPTEIHANLNIQAVASLDKLAAMLGQSLVEESKTIDVTPTQDSSSNQAGRTNSSAKPQDLLTCDEKKEPSS